MTKTFEKTTKYRIIRKNLKTINIECSYFVIHYNQDICFCALALGKSFKDFGVPPHYTFVTRYKNNNTDSIIATFDFNSTLAVIDTNDISKENSKQPINLYKIIFKCGLEDIHIQTREYSSVAHNNGQNKGHYMVGNSMFDYDSVTSIIKLK